MMPAFGRDGAFSKPGPTSEVADYVRTLSGNAPGVGADIDAGRRSSPTIAPPATATSGKGNIEIGAPNLTTQIWRYGPTKARLGAREDGGGATMPAWTGRLDEPTIKALAVFVHSLGGGK